MGRRRHIDYALAYARHGIPVLPLAWIVERGGSRVCGCRKGADCPSPGKHPLVKGGWKAATTDDVKIQEWWERFENANVGVSPGHDFVIIDVDPRNGGNESLSELPDLPPTFVVTTGGGGRHYWFKLPEGVESMGAAKLSEGIDFLGLGAVAVAPPSRHVSGKLYKPETKLSAMATLPDWVRERLEKVKSSPGESGDKVDLSRPIEEGERNNRLTQIAGWLHGRGASKELILELLSGVNENLCSPPLPDEDIDQIVDSVTGYDRNLGPLTDLGNARRLVQMYGDTIRYVPEWDKWLVWNGKRWKPDRTGTVERYAKSVSAVMHDVASKLEAQSSKFAKAVRSFAYASESAGKISAMVRLARTEEEVVIGPERIDAYPDLLCCRNGVINLKRGTIFAHSKARLLSKWTPIEYDPKARAPRWERFLLEIFAGDQDYVDWIQRAVGYTLTGHASEQVLFLLHGGGANGKSTFLEIIRGIMGDYAKQADFSTFAYSQRTGVRNDLAMLAGARLVLASESREGAKLDEAVVKQLTGGDAITARFLFEEFFTFKPSFAIWLATNHRPRIDGTDHAIWRRIRLLPFSVQIPKDKQDKDLLSKLKQEYPGILRWAVEGALAWYKEGLGSLEVVTEATEQYKKEQDILGEFIDEKCRISPGKHVFSQELYDTYLIWAKAKGIKYPFGQRRFNNALRDRGFVKKRTSKGFKWMGIEIRMR